jgi:GNAT superfamily N-acetyltransferase
MEPNVEIRRLLDVMPASGRMTTKLVSKPEQAKVIDASFPQPWNQARPIYINFDLWRRLTKPQRDLLLLQMVSWLTAVKWFKPDIYQGVVLAGLLGGFLEAAQADVVGVAVAGGLSAIAAFRIWRTNKSQDSELNADVAAIRIAQRRGYSETEAAQHLLSAIEAVAKIEGSSLNFTELIRCQNLRAIAGLSPLGMPESYK